MLWDIIYDFFVHHVFGGYDTNDVIHSAFFGEGYNVDDGLNPFATYEINAITLKDLYGTEVSFSLGNYLSFIATLITMVAIVLICCALIKKIYNMCAHIIG